MDHSARQLLFLRVVAPVDDGALWDVGQSPEAGWEVTEQNLRSRQQGPPSPEPDPYVGPAKPYLKGTPRARLQNVTIGTTSDKPVPGMRLWSVYLESRVSGDGVAIGLDGVYPFR